MCVPSGYHTAICALDMSRDALFLIILVILFFVFDYLRLLVNEFSQAVISSEMMDPTLSAFLRSARSLLPTRDSFNQAETPARAPMLPLHGKSEVSWFLCRLYALRAYAAPPGTRSEFIF